MQLLHPGGRLGKKLVRIEELMHSGEIKGLLSICFNPKVSLPDNAFVTRCLDKLEFYAVIEFFLSETARYADVVLPACTNFERTDISEWAGLGGYGHHGQQQVVLQLARHPQILFQLLVPAAEFLGEGRPLADALAPARPHRTWPESWSRAAWTPSRPIMLLTTKTRKLSISARLPSGSSVSRPPPPSCTTGW